MPPQQPQQLDQDIVRLARSVRKIESGDKFDARGGSGEFGAYQYTAPTWAAQARMAGVATPYDQASREDQNKVFYTWAKKKKDEGYNLGQIASMHNAGEGRPNAYIEGNKGVNKYGVSYDTASYAEKVAREYHNLKQTEGSYQVPADVQRTQAPPQVQEEPKQDLLSGASKFLQGLFPTKNIGEALGTELAYLMAKPEERQYIAPSTATAGGIAGDIAQNAAYFVGGGAIPAVRGATLASRLGSGAIAGAKFGAGAGALSGAGQQLSEGGDLANAAGGAITGGLTGALAGGVLGGAIPAIPAVAGRIANRGQQSSGNIVEEMVRANAAGKTVPKLGERLAENQVRSTEAAGKILQGTTDEAALGARVLPEVDTSKVKSYADLNKAIQSNIDDELRIVDREFASSPNPVKLKDLTQTVSAGEGSKLKMKVNYVEDSLKQLRELYTKTRDIKESLRIKALTEKARTVGLNPTEINTLAKEYGREFRAKGFSKVGQQLTSVSDQAMENTRKGLKETARQFLKTDAARAADKKASDLINVQKLVDKMEEKVNALEQRIKKRGIMEKVGRGLGLAVDVATFGTIRGFLGRFFPSNVGLKTMNSLDIENNLQKNLKLLDRLNSAPDSEVEAFLRNLIGGSQQQ